MCQASRRCLQMIEWSVARIPSADQHVYDARKVTCDTGVAFIDLALRKILPTDLVLIGAKTGAGKTQIMAQIAGHMSEMGKKVFYLALEAEKDEIEMRLRYQILVSKVKQNNVYAHLDLSYRNFRLGGLSEEMLRYGNEIDEEFMRRFKNLFTAYPDIGFNHLDLADCFDKARAMGAECIFLDHIHFMDTISGGEESNEGLTQIIKNVRRLNLQYEIPVITAGHLRKDFDKIIPTKEDFHGTSNLSKVATVCILIAKDAEGFDPVSGHQRTFFFIDKSRTGSFGNMIGCMWFSTEDNRYMEHVALAWAAPDFKSVTLLDRAKYPKWANINLGGRVHVLSQQKINELKDGT